MANANLIDSFLNETPQVKAASADLGDSLLDSGSRRLFQHNAPNRSAKYATGEGELAEVALNHAARHIAKAASAVRMSVEGALRIVQDLPRLIREANVDRRNKVARQKKDLEQASRRLERLARKSDSQMKFDGASKLADYLDPAMTPSWAKQVRADVKLIYAASQTLNPAPAAKQASSEKLLAERSMTDAEVTGYIHKLLNDGVTPKDVEAKLSKLAELQVFDRSFATEKLRNDAGLVGYAFLEPNSYMDNCPASYQRMTTKLGGVRAHSVKQIAACTGCQNFKKQGNSKRCNLYRLPVVATKQELVHIVASITPGITPQNKKAALVAQANRETERPIVRIKEAGQVGIANSRISRVTEAVSIRTDENRKRASRDVEFTKEDALKLHNAGQKLRDIHKHAQSKVGSQQADAAVRGFVSDLKGSKTKVALTQIDCTLLGQKLSSSNAIIGESKCASCTYRQGMHCGYTGGTLLVFPGMDKIKSNHRTAADAPKDGMGMLKEFELTHQIVPDDIDIAGPNYAEVELTGFSKVDF